MKRPRTTIVIAALAIVYFVAGKLGLLVAFVHPSATAIWPCTGIALAAFLIFGYRVWPGILLGAFLVNITTAGSVPVCLAIAAGNTLEGLTGAFLVNRYAGGRKAMEHTADVIRFALLGGILSSALGATIGVTSLAVGSFAGWHGFVPIWATWWLGDAAGAVVLAPAILLWWADPRPAWLQIQFGESRVLEANALLISLSVTALFVFGGLSAPGTRGYPLEYLCVPFLIWAAFRFGPREAATANILMAAIATWGTLRGTGPFAIGARNESLLLLQTFVGIVAMMTMALAAVLTERQRAEEQTMRMAVSDPLTGIGNYRKVIDALQAEINRSDRTGRPFAFLLFDLDGLKQINDGWGHLVGNRALCRLAHVLQNHSRAIDSPARFGGDEFALVLPEADGEAALQIARRIAARLAEDHEQPALSVSYGTAVWPEDGLMIETLLRNADHKLYEMKRRTRSAEKPEKLSGMDLANHGR